MKAAFTEAGFTPYDHFVAFGNAENLSPNSQFDMQYYLASKAVDLNSVAYQGKQDWTGEKVYQAIQDSGLSVWDHYQQYGAVEGIAPNSNFDSDKYYLAKVAQLNSTAHEGRTDWTVDEVKQAFQDAGLSPLAHYAEYGSSEKMDNYATGNANFAVVDNDADVQQMITDNPFDPTTGNKDYTLADAMAASEDGTLSEVYTLTDLNAGDVTVAEYGAIKGLVDGAFNSADLDPAAAVYTLNDTLANLQDASTTAIKGSVVGSDSKIIITDSTGSKGILDASDHLAASAIDALLGTNSSTTPAAGTPGVEYRLIGTSENDNFSIHGLLNGNLSAANITMLAGGDGADVVFGSAGNDILFAGGFSEKVGDVYAESQQSAIAAGSTIPLGFYNSIAQYVKADVVGKYFTGHNILDGRGGKNDLVASNQADTFLIQLGGGGTGIDSETPGENIIHNFKVGQDFLFVMDQSDRTGDGAGGLLFSAGWTKAELMGKDITSGKDNVVLAMTGENSFKITISKEFLNEQDTVSGAGGGGGSNTPASADLVINLVGVQNADASTTAADLFGITAA